MKRIGIFLSIILLLCCVRAGFQMLARNASDTNGKPASIEEIIDEVDPLLYVATDADGDRVWLFGSIHVGFDEMYPLPDYVTDAFEEADSLAVEADITDTDAMLGSYGDMLKGLSYNDGTTIKDHIDASVYEAAVKILEDNHYVSSALEEFRPYMWSSLIDEITLSDAGLSAELGVDRHLLALAEESDKPVKEVESVEFQYDMLSGFSDEIQEMILEQTVESYQNGTSVFSIYTMMYVWCRGDEALFANLLSNEDAGLDEEDSVLYEEYNRQMVTERNIGMADYAEQALKDGEEIFICVGAAHVVGDDAMVDLLRERGYTVERV